MLWKKWSLNWLSSNCKNKVTKTNLRITAKCHAHLQNLTKTPAKFRRSCVHKIPSVYMLWNKWSKNWLSSNCKKSYKNNLRITAKPHAHLQTLTKPPVKFQKDPDKIVGEVAFIRLDTICDGQSDGRTLLQLDTSWVLTVLEKVAKKA